MIEYVLHFSTPTHNLVPPVREVLETVNKFMGEIERGGPKLTTSMTEVFAITVGPFQEPLPPDKYQTLLSLISDRAAVIDGVPFTLTKTEQRTRV